MIFLCFHAHRQAATGPGSDATKKKLLQLYLKDGIKSPGFVDMFVQLGIVKGSRTTEEWHPYKHMADYYGVAEFMRRLQSGSIKSRKDGGEWQFQQVKEVVYKDESMSGGVGVKTNSKLDKGMLQDAVSSLPVELKTFLDDGSQANPELLNYLESKGAIKKNTGGEIPKEKKGWQDECHDKLSEISAGSASKPKEIIKNALNLLQQTKAGGLTPNGTVIIDHHISKLNGILSKKGITVEAVKGAIFDAMKALKAL